MEAHHESPESSPIRVLIVDDKANSIAWFQEQLGEKTEYELDWQKDYQTAFNACLSGYYHIGFVGSEVTTMSGELDAGLHFIEDLRDHCCTIPLLYLASSNQLEKLNERRLSTKVDVIVADELEGQILGDQLENKILDCVKAPNSERYHYEERERLSVSLNCVKSGIILIRDTGAIEYVNLAAEKLLGISLSDVIGQPLLNNFQVFDEVSNTDFVDVIVEKITGNMPFSLGSDVKLISASGESVAVECQFTPIFSGRLSSKSNGFVIAIDDISEKLSFDERLNYESTHDRLTGLPNRVEFEKSIQDSIDNAHEYQQSHCVLYMDVDQFKVINDTCGHLAGDEMLLQLSELLTRAVRQRDTVTRLGGDEFGVVLWRCTVDQGNDAVQTIMDALNGYRFQWNDKNFVVTMSVGMVAVDNTSMTWADVLSMADSACYEAKEAGRNRVYLADSNDPRTAKRVNDMEWVSELMQGMEEGGFQFHAQKIQAVEKPLSESSQEASGGEYFEMLLRYSDRLGNLHLPEDFLPAAQRYNIISLIDQWVVTNLLGMLSEQSVWLKDKKMVSINLSAVTIQDEQTLEYFLSRLRESSVDLSKISFEITETVIVNFITGAKRFIEAIKALGCGCGLGDFGAGVSSFSYLKNLPVDYVKINGQLVNNVVQDPVDCSLVRSINDIAHIMGMETIAPRCDSEVVYEKLIELGVDYIQGDYVGEPMPSSEIFKT